MSLSVWFWQRMITPHMVHLALALARRGHQVSYVAEEPMSAERASMGWAVPDMEGVRLFLAPNPEAARDLAGQAPPESIHLTQGLRANGVVAAAQREIRGRNLRHFAIMETVDQRGRAGFLKPPLYGWHLWRWRRDLEGILAIGADTPAWLARLAPPSLRIHPFAYFLPESACLDDPMKMAAFRFLFVGSLIELKRVGLLLASLGRLADSRFTLDIIGDGPMRAALQDMAERLLPGRVRFHGTLPMVQIEHWMTAADCLVLPSAHDGWGAVISEALMAGTPVICSSACGAKALVTASGAGGVFDKDDPEALLTLLQLRLDHGRNSQSERQALWLWARCAGSEAGAAYLEAVLYDRTGANPIFPPWSSAATTGQHQHGRSS